MRAGTRPEVDNMIGGPDRLLVVLDDDHGIAGVAQRLEGAEQPLVVALMQSDRGLIENVHDTRQAGPHLAGKPDALRLAAGKSFGTAIERQVVQADVDEEAQSLAHVAHDLRRDFATPALPCRANGSARARGPR